MAKIAISLPDSFLEIIERESKARSMSRSEFLRQAVEALLKHEQEREDVRRYVQGYLAYPETDEEVAWAEAASQSILAEYPWHDETGK